MISVVSSTTPGIVENSCRTPSIWMEVTAAPGREDSRMRRRELPRLVPYPRCKGSTTNFPYRLSSLISTASIFGFSISIIRIRTLLQNVRSGAISPTGHHLRPIQYGRKTGDLNQNRATHENGSDAAPLWRTTTVVGNGRHVFDQIDIQSGSLQGATGRLPAGARSLDQPLHRFHPVFHRLFGRRLRSQLGGIGSAFPGTLEAHRTRAGPGDGVAAGIGNGDDGVVEG